MDIYTILCSKSTNFHYIRKYINFIENCNIKNKLLNGCLEAHHICPKASDLFPEYKDFNTHPWNKVHLSSREHIIAHVMLWKIFGGSQTYALDFMLLVAKSTKPKVEKYFNQNQKIPTSILIRYSAKLREEVTKLNIGLVNYMDENGDFFGKLPKDDPRIQEFNLRPQFTKKQKKHYLVLMQKSIEANTGSTIYNNGKIEKRFKSIPDDPQWILGRLPRTQEHLDNQAEGLRAKITGTKCFHNGTVMIRVPKDQKPEDLYPDDIWVPGMLPRTEECKTTQYKLISERFSGSMYWNNGQINIRLQKDLDPKSLYPDSDWIRGRLPRTKEQLNNQLTAVRKRLVGSTLWNNGEIIISVPKGQKPEDLYPDDIWIRGMLPRKLKVI